MKTTLIIVLSIAVIGMGTFLFLSNKNGPTPQRPSNGDVTVNQPRGTQTIDTQNVDADQQSGGVDTFNNNGNGNVVIESRNDNTRCKNNSQKNYGQLSYQGNTGPMCKKPASVSPRIKREKCQRKGLTIHQNLCVMEWVSVGEYWRVRILKD